MGGFAADDQRDLTAPEYAVLLAGKRTVIPSVVMRAAFVETLARGAVRLETHGVSSRGKAHDQRLIVLADGPVDDLGPVLRPVVDALESAKVTTAVDGAVGVTVTNWAYRFKTSPGTSRYVSAVVQPALVSRGLLAEQRRRFLPGSHLVLTSDGEVLAGSARARVDTARARVDKKARKAWANDPAAAAATLAALGSLGTLVLADPELVAALVELRGVCQAADSSAAGAAAMVPLWATGGIDGSGADGSGFDGLDSSAFDGLDGGAFDGLDLSDLSSFDSSFGGGFGGGFDGGGGGDGGGSSS